MLKCYQCGCEDELAVGLIWESQTPKVVCLACEGVYELPEEDYAKYQIAIEVAKQAARKYQTPCSIRNLTTGEISEIDEADLPF